MDLHLLLYIFMNHSRLTIRRLVGLNGRTPKLFFEADKGKSAAYKTSDLLLSHQPTINVINGENSAFSLSIEHQLLRCSAALFVI